MNRKTNRVWQIAPWSASPEASAGRAGLGKRCRAGAVLAALAVGAGALGGCNNAGEGAISGTLIGAGAGAIIGSLTGSAGRGAIIGAAAGAIGGGVLGDQNARSARNASR